MTAEPDLLPCPFCGGRAERIDFGPGDAENEGGSCIACTGCQSSGPVEFGYKENFISNWNRRATAAKDAEIEALRARGERAEAEARDYGDQRDEAIGRAEQLAGALRDLEVCANTADYCYSRRPSNFASALVELRESAEKARALLREQEAGRG